MLAFYISGYVMALTWKWLSITKDAIVQSKNPYKSNLGKIGLKPRLGGAFEESGLEGTAFGYSLRRDYILTMTLCLGDALLSWLCVLALLWASYRLYQSRRKVPSSITDPQWRLRNTELSATETRNQLLLWASEVKAQYWVEYLSRLNTEQHPQRLVGT
jgi:hypothetical protein